MKPCRFVATNQPRIIDNDGTPCPHPHCRVCGYRHTNDDQPTCPTCVGNTRDNITTIENLYDRLPDETIHRGINSEAANLEGPNADPEAWSWHKISARQGHITHPTLTEDDDILGPLWILGTWTMLVRELLDQPTVLKVTVANAGKYLRARLTDLAQNPDLAYEELAKDIRKCRAHLEAILHAQPMGDRAGVGCFDCGDDLERKLTDTGFEDVRTCRGCRRRYTIAEYNVALRAAIENEAL